MITLENGFWSLCGSSIWFLREHPQWQIKHPLGPVTWDHWCDLCKKIIVEDHKDSSPNLACAEHIQWHKDQVEEEEERVRREQSRKELVESINKGEHYSI
jgi:hypothetical protein